MSSLPIVDFEPADLASVTDPYPLFATVRAAGPVAVTRSGFHVVATYEAAMAVLRHPASTSAPIALRYTAALPPGAARDEMSHRINFLDPPDHPRVRGIVSKAFTPRRVDELRSFVEATARDRLEKLPDSGSFDLLHDFAHQVPSLVISEMLGVPAADRDRLTALSDAVTPLLGVQLSDEERTGALAAAEEMHAYFSALIDERRREKGNDLLSALIDAEDEGARLSRVELLSLAATLYSAGHRTTRDLTSNGMSVLLRDGDALQAQMASKVATSALVWEFLRHETPTLYVARIPREDQVIGGVTIPAGSAVLVLLAAANHDAAAYFDAERFVVGRFSDTAAPPPTPLSFAFGPHFCLGASLAKMEAEVMIDALLARYRSIAVAGDLTWRHRGPFRSLESLPVHVQA